MEVETFQRLRPGAKGGLVDSVFPVPLPEIPKAALVTSYRATQHGQRGCIARRVGPPACRPPIARGSLRLIWWLLAWGAQRGLVAEDVVSGGLRLDLAPALRERLVAAFDRLALRYPLEVKPLPSGYEMPCPSCGRPCYPVIVINPGAAPAK